MQRYELGWMWNLNFGFLAKEHGGPREKFLDLKLASYEAVPRIDHPGIRISRACENVTRHIKNGDREAAWIGCLIIFRDPHINEKSKRLLEYMERTF